MSKILIKSYIDFIICIYKGSPVIAIRDPSLRWCDCVFCVKELRGYYPNDDEALASLNFFISIMLCVYECVMK